MVFLLFIASFITPAFALADTTGGSISGRVVDGQTALPLQGVSVQAIGNTQKTTRTDANGDFKLGPLTHGSYHLRLALAGYQTTLSDEFEVAANATATVTLSMQRQETGNSGIRTLGRTTIRASQSLQRSSIVYKQQSVETIERQGIYRVGDFLRTLPQVNLSAATGGSDTPSPGDDLYLDIRGIGGLETVALIDGHPIGFGINRGKNLGYNWEIAPTFALRTVQVTYGSGVAGLTPYSAVGGVIDMLTLEPTPQAEANFSQGWGTYSKLVTSLNGTGTIQQRLGYGFALGVQSIDGPYKNEFFFQPAAAFDPSAPAGTVAHDSGIYKDDTAVANRGDFLKLRYALGDLTRPTHLTLSMTHAAYWDDKTGNGDQDFLPFDTALAIGNAGVAGYAGPPNPNVPACAAGQFTPTNANGSPWGFGPNGKPDGGTSCVTAQRYAQIASGFQGAGAAYQAFRIGDYHLQLDGPVGPTTMAFSLYTNYFYQLYDRTFQEPYFASPGDNFFTISPRVNTTGASLTDTLPGTNNDIGIGFATNNYAYLFAQNGSQQPSPIVHDNTFYLQDVLHPSRARYQLYLNAAEQQSSITNTMVFNPRLAFVQELANDNVVRFAAGATSIQPYATYISLPFSPIATGALNGNLNCTGLTTIGQVSNPSLQPERANDQELSFGHRFAGDSQIQLTFYNENVNEKIYSTIIPAATALSKIPPATLAAFGTAINAACGGTGIAGVGVNSQANVGRLLARGFDFNGRARVNSKLFFDYDYSLESSALRSADVTTLQNNLVLIVGSQLPGVPLHKGSLAVDGTFGRNIDVRLEQNWVAANNSKNSPAYNYGNLLINVPYSNRGSFSLGVNNVFNQFTQYNGLIGHGYPLPLNQFATHGQYQPLIGTSATELYGLPYRQLFVSYNFHFHQ